MITTSKIVKDSFFGWGHFVFINSELQRDRQETWADTERVGHTTKVPSQSQTREVVVMSCNHFLTRVFSDIFLMELSVHQLIVSDLD